MVSSADRVVPQTVVMTYKQIAFSCGNFMKAKLLYFRNAEYYCFLYYFSYLHRKPIHDTDPFTGTYRDGLSFTLSVSSCNWRGESATKSMSSAKRRLLSISQLSITPALTQFNANLITASRSRLIRSGDSPHPCLTLTVILKHC